MYRFFSNNNFLAYAMLPVLLIVFRLRLILSPEISTLGSDADLYTFVWLGTFGRITAGTPQSIAVAMALTLLTALVVNNTANKYRYTPHISNLGGMFFIVLSSGFIVSQGLHPMSVFMLAQAVALHQLFKGAQEGYKPNYHCFNAALVCGAATLFWAKGIWFLPLLVVYMGILKVLSFRTFLCALMGYATLPIMAAAWMCVDGGLGAEAYAFLQASAVPVAFLKTPPLSAAYIVLYGLLLLAAIFNTINALNTFKISQSRIARSLIWHTLSSALLLLLPAFSFEVQMLVAVSGATLLASWSQRLKNKRFREIACTGFALFALLTQSLA